MAVTTMNFISIYFVVLFAFLLFGYYSFPKKYQYIFILICNIIFYASYLNNAKEAIALTCVVLFSWGGGNLMEYCNTQKSTRAAFFLTIIFSVASLVYFKYCDFILDNLNRINFRLADKDIVRRHSIVAPIGISFFSFQALGYVIDVYHKKIRAEKNLFRYAAFVSFFPTITSGPINRSDNLLAQMQRKEGKFISCESLYSGFMLALYGAFLKMVIAGRLSVLTDTVFNNYKSYGGFILFFASVCYTFQIYCDFSSYSLIAIGISRMLGYEVVENFKAPYFSENIQEFWRRWHISLSTWFRDYIYIPLGGNQCSKCRKNLNLLITFIVSGLWHGANWTFVFWGFLHGIYQIVGNITKSIRKYMIDKLHIKTQCFSFHLWKKFWVFNCVSLAWIFFRSETIVDAFFYIFLMMSRVDIWDMFNGKIYQLGLNTLQMDILLLAVMLFIVLDYKKYKEDINIDVILRRQNFLFRCFVICGLFAATLVFGMYGPEFNVQDFIYIRF